VRRWRQLFTAAVFAAFAVALIVKRQEIGEAAGEIGELDASWVMALLLLVAIGVAVEGIYTSSVTPQLTLGQAVLMQQSVTAANNTVIGSGPVATGVRIAMMRSWGISDTSIGVSIVALNVVAAYRLWLIALATAVAGAAGADGGVLDSRLYTVVIVIAILVLAGSTVLWWVLLWRPRLAAVIARLTQRVWNRLRRSIRRLPPLDVHLISDRARAEARGIVRTNGLRITLATIADQAITVLKPLAVVRAFGIGSDVISTWQVLIAFGLVRLAVALTPIPGGVGVTEVGLAALLVRFGGPESTVLAAVLVFRALTFVLPIVTGGVCFAVWRSRLGIGPGRPRLRNVATDASAGPARPGPADGRCRRRATRGGSSSASPGPPQHR
jgi:uncharacterized membrane protein YbhN (UPF0104 family)